MVDLPSYEKTSGLSAGWLRPFRQWLERDLNESRPLSLVLAIAPLLPAIVAGELGLSGAASIALWTVGGFLSAVWFVYILVKHIGRQVAKFRRQLSDINAHKRGEELPTRCPGCGMDFPEFEPPKDGRIYRFDGWECENCGMSTDGLGHQI